MESLLNSVGCYTGVVHATMRAMGLSAFTLPVELRPLLPERALAGPAFTIEGKVDPKADAHETLLAWTGLLSKAISGSANPMTAWSPIWASSPPRRSLPISRADAG